jgi:hypothetical protein
MVRRFTPTRVGATALATLAAVLFAVFSLAGPAAAVTREQKLDVMSGWTQTSAASYSAFHSARANRGAWGDYGFDWSTDYCSNSPDNPLGFDFRLSCVRHDFGYRNYKSVGLFKPNKGRVDSAFYEDMKRKCKTYNIVVRPACYSLAWTYYKAVDTFGKVKVSQAEIDRAAQMLP